MSRAVTAVVAVVALLAVGVGTVWLLNWRAERAAEIEAANAEVRAEIALLYTQMEETAGEGGDAAAMLHLTLQEHLTVTDRTDEELAEDRELQQQTLVATGQRLQRLASEPRPQIPEHADASAIRPELEQLEQMQARADDLGQRFVAVASAAETWTESLVNLREHADRYVETVEGQPDTSDPNRLRELWEEERDVLVEYEEAARLAAEVPGLSSLAEAYLAYVEANLEFAEEAIALLEENEIDEYNERLRETYGEEDPFGFQAAVATATEGSFDVGVLAELAEIRDEASSFAVRVTGLRRQITPSPAPTPS
jgi:hypothetical protein